MRGLEQARYQAKRSFKRRIAEKETHNPAIIAKVGNGAGTVMVPGRSGWIYVRLHGDDNQLTEAKLGIPLDTSSLNDAWMRVKKASPRKASYYVVEEFVTSSTGSPAPPLTAHPLDPDAGPHTGSLTEDDVVFDDIAGHDHQGTGSTGKKITAGSVINVPAGGIAATDVQTAINELDAEKAGIANAETISADWLFSGDKKLQFRGVSQFIHSPAPGNLLLAALTIFLDADARPNAAGTYSLGGVNKEWLNLYLSEEIYFGLNQDISLGRGAADRLDLGTDDNIRFSNTAGEYMEVATAATAVYLMAEESAAGDACFSTRVVADAVFRFSIRADGQQEWGDGAGATDTVLGRAAANLLATGVGDSLWVKDTLWLGSTQDVELSRGGPNILNIPDIVRQIRDGTVYHMVRRYSNDVSAGLLMLDKARGTEASPAVVQSADFLGRIVFRGYSAAAGTWHYAAEIRGGVDGVPDSGGDTTDMPGMLRFFTTPDGSATLAERQRIANDGGIFMYSLKSGANQAAAGAAVDELWHDTTDDTIKIGV